MKGNTTRFFLPDDKGYIMYKVMKFFIFLGVLLVAAFFANHFGVVSIPWLDVKPVATYVAMPFDLMRRLRKCLNNQRPPGEPGA